MENPFALFENLPKTFRVELICDREKGVLDAQVYDATETVKEGQLIVSGCDELNAKLAKGWQLIKILRPRVPPCRYLVEREKSFAEKLEKFTHSTERRPFD